MANDDSDDMVKRAERDVLDAAIKWYESQLGKQSPSSSQSQQLRVAVIMLKNARKATGRVKIPQLPKK